MGRICAEITGHYVYLSVQGTEYRVYYEEAGHGVPVLCFHTAGSDGRQWRHLLEDSELTKEFRFVAPDLPFHGKSLPPTSEAWWSRRYSLNQAFLLDFVQEIATTLALEGGIYMGCSMGGHLAPDIALHRPGLFRAVLAIQGGLATLDEEAFNKFLSHPRVSNEAKGALMMGQTSPMSPEPLRRETGWLYQQGGPQVFQGDLDYYLGEHDISATAKDIDTTKTQVHVVAGVYDWSATPERAKGLADAIPGATYTRMDGTGHFPMSENPDVFKRHVVPLLRTIVQSGTA